MNDEISSPVISVSRWIDLEKHVMLKEMGSKYTVTPHWFLFKLWRLVGTNDCLV